MSNATLEPDTDSDISAEELKRFQAFAESGSTTYYTPTPVRDLVVNVKQADQDFEFYPTTNEIIRHVARCIGLKDNEGRGCKHTSVLDIGAGSGKVLTSIRDLCGVEELFAIEKSHVLCEQLDPQILVVGTEFEEQSLLSKHVDIIFCNPPYSKFEDWTVKIIRESAAQRVFLVIPERWQQSTPIADALKFRGVSMQKLGDYDFANAEDRKARAKVHLLSVSYHRDYHDKEKDDAFEAFFKEQFADLIGRFEAAEPPKSEEDTNAGRGGGRTRPYHKLVVGPNYPDALVALYRQEMANIEHNYQRVSELDVELLREFEIFPAKIMAGLKQRLKGLKSEYWNELFSHFSKITDRLTSKSRKSLLGTLSKHIEVDFTGPNIYEVVVWVLKNANRYIDSQLIDTYEQMVEKANVKLYKSNHRVWVENRWRSRDEADPNSHYALDYRIVTHRLGGCRPRWSMSDPELSEEASNFIGDMLTLARNLGFNTDTADQRLTYDGRRHWTPGATEQFYYTKKGERELLMDVRAFINGNVHFRFNKDFILALNVEHGRLRGWLRTPAEAVEELQDPDAAQYFNTSLKLGAGNPMLLLT